MSQKFIPGYADPQGILATGFGGIGFGLIAEGSGAPTNAVAGYQTGCIYHRRDGTGDTAVYINIGTETSSSWLAIPQTAFGRTLATEAGAGITGGVGALYNSSVVLQAGLYTTTITVDLTGLASSTTDLDIIGVSTTPAHLGQITAARCGTIFAGIMTCLETPAGGADDVDLYSATEATGVFDSAVTDLTETAMLSSGGAWTAGTSKGLTANPAANQYLYLTGGEAGTAATYTAGIFRLTLYGR